MSLLNNFITIYKTGSFNKELKLFNLQKINLYQHANSP